MFEPLERSRAFEQVVEQIEEAILSGRLKPGDRLPSERVLTDQFQVGRSSVREGLRILESMGLLAINPGSPLGPLVSATNKDGLLRLMSGYVHTRGVGLGSLVQYRMISGSAANFLAAYERTDEHMSRLRQANDAMRSPDVEEEEFARHDLLFHQTVADASGNPFLSLVNSLIADLIVDLMKRAIKQAASTHEIRTTFIRTHDELIEAIGQGDGIRASRIARHSLFEYYKELLNDDERAKAQLLVSRQESEGYKRFVGGESPESASTNAG